ncbi:oxidoreductase [Paucibacter sp. XJ19-41]|uniref:oxidoreductase n=1 Tax=Paucibacter sp. XJ19-41 TaxID=2927824 RepID=UPI002349332D|nr:oxidoreductase [Paucibacter sp. XJ19-41]MDC6166278.1 oxidoreductase [Paucibacter sp. XJ19-41]
MTTDQKQQPVAIVTGATAGIGAATAHALHAAGYRVFGTYRRPPKTRLPGIDYVACDVTDDLTVEAAVREVLAKTGRIDLLVNNAGLGLIGAAEESSLEQARSVFDVNLFGVIRMTNAVLPAMRQQRSGRIVNISSVMGLIPAPFMALYSSSKHAVEGYSQSLDHELRVSGIRVVLVEPSYTRTTFESKALMADQKSEHYALARANAEAVMNAETAKADPPEVVAETIVAAATVAKPQLRYAAGRDAATVSLLRRFVPASAFDRSLRKRMRMPA